MKLLIVLAAPIASAVLVVPTVTQADGSGMSKQAAARAAASATELRA
jgi:hypothetical protein